MSSLCTVGMLPTLTVHNKSMLRLKTGRNHMKVFREKLKAGLQHIANSLNSYRDMEWKLFFES